MALVRMYGLAHLFSTPLYVLTCWAGLCHATPGQGVGQGCSSPSLSGSLRILYTVVNGFWSVASDHTLYYTQFDTI